MKLSLFTFILVILAGMISYSQKTNFIEYHNYVNKAEYYLYTHQKTEQAKHLYLKAFKMVPEPLAKDCYMLARCYARLGEYDSAWIFLQKSSPTSIIFNTPSEIIQQDTFYFEQLLKVHPELIDKLKILDSINLNIYIRETESIKSFVDSCCTEDQLYRKLYLEANPQTKEESDYNKDLLRNRDNLLHKKLICYINKNGYPGILTCGTDIIVLVLLHMKDENYESIKDFLYNELINGRMMPYEIGQIVDRNEYINKNLCGLTPNPNRCSETDWDSIIKNRLKYGCSIYFSNSMRNILGKKDLLPWVGKLIEK